MITLHVHWKHYTGHQFNKEFSTTTRLYSSATKVYSLWHPYFSDLLTPTSLRHTLCAHSVVTQGCTTPRFQLKQYEKCAFSRFAQSLSNTFPHTLKQWIHMRGTPAAQRQKQHKLETWNLQIPDSMCVGWKWSCMRKWHGLFSLFKEAIHAAAAGLSQWQWGMAEFLPKFSQELLRSQWGRLRETNSSCVAEQIPLCCKCQSYIRYTPCQWYCAPRSNAVF